MARPLSAGEHSIIEVLLSEPFPGRDELREQLPLVKVTGLDCNCGCGSLALSVDRSAPGASVLERMPCDGFGSDEAGHTIGVLLFVDDGYMSCLEFYDAGAGDQAFGPPRPETVELARWTEPDEQGISVALNGIQPGEDDEERR